MKEKKISPYVMPGIFENILNVICKFTSESTGVGIHVIRSGKRVSRDNETAKQIFCALSRQFSESTWYEIRDYLGVRNHATAIHAVKATGKYLESDKGFADKYWMAYYKLKSHLELSKSMIAES